MALGETTRDRDQGPVVARRAAIRTQRRRWRQAAPHWDDHAGADLGAVVEAVLAEASASGKVGLAVDLGAGTGALSVPLARRAERVIAVDVSEPMLTRLSARAAGEGARNIELAVGPIEELALEPSSVDLVVSNYALHHLLDADKALIVKRAATWLRPGGRIVIGDMMLGRGLTASDRQIIAGKVRALAAKGPGGWWRILKNSLRFLGRMSERPVPVERWEALLEEAGFEGVSSRRVVAEAAVVSGRKA